MEVKNNGCILVGQLNLAVKYTQLRWLRVVTQWSVNRCFALFSNQKK